MRLARSRAQASKTGENYVLEARFDLGGATLPVDSLTTVSCFDSQVALPQALQCQSIERRSAMLMVHDHCLHATGCVNLQLLIAAD